MYLDPLRQNIFLKVFQQIIKNRDIHILVFKIYLHVDAFGADQLKKVGRLIQDNMLQLKLEKHIADEEKHSSLFKQRIIDWGGAPEMTIEEQKLGFLAPLYAHSLGIKQERFTINRPLDMEEIVRFIVYLKSEEEKGINIFPSHLAALNREMEKDLKTIRLLEEIIDDEKYHVEYLTHELEEFAIKGFGSIINEALKSYRAVHRSFKPAVVLLATAEQLNFRPVGKSAQILWPLLRGLLKLRANKK